MKETIRKLPVMIVAVFTAGMFFSIGVQTVDAGLPSQAKEIETETATEEKTEREFPGAGVVIEPFTEKEETPEETEAETEKEPERIEPDREDPMQYMVAKVTMAEAEGESLRGKALVAKVIYNRLESDLFPDTIPEVINQPGAFSCISGGRYDEVEPNEDCWEALEMVLNGWDESGGALFFERSDNVGTWQQRNRPYLYTEGNHSFYG